MRLRLRNTAAASLIVCVGLLHNIVLDTEYDPLEQTRRAIVMLHARHFTTTQSQLSWGGRNTDNVVDILGEFRGSMKNVNM